MAMALLFFMSPDQEAKEKTRRIDQAQVSRSRLRVFHDSRRIAYIIHQNIKKYNKRYTIIAEKSHHMSRCGALLRFYAKEERRKSTSRI